jgi:hypothetical protein
MIGFRTTVSSRWLGYGKRRHRIHTQLQAHECHGIAAAHRRDAGACFIHDEYGVASAAGLFGNVRIADGAATGPAFNAVPFLPADVTENSAGTATFTFTDGNTGTFNYTVNGVTQTKGITREVFATPGTVCQ